MSKKPDRRKIKEWTRKQLNTYIEGYMDDKATSDLSTTHFLTMLDSIDVREGELRESINYSIAEIKFLSILFFRLLEYLKVDKEKILNNYGE